MTADKKAALLNNLSKQNSRAPMNVAAGTGLIICKKLVELMGGWITMESNEKYGTTFCFTISCKTGIKALRMHQHAEITDLENKKILIIDDNAFACDL